MPKNINSFEAKKGCPYSGSLLLMRLFFWNYQLIADSAYGVYVLGGSGY